VFRNAGGTASTPTAIASATTLGGVFFNGYDGASYRSSAAIYGFTDGTVSTGSSPGGLQFLTTPNGATTATERLRLTSDGRLGVGTSGPGYLFDVAGQARVAGDFHVSGGSVIDGLSQDLFLQGNAGYGIIFRTNGSTERARLDSSGRLLVGTSSAIAGAYTSSSKFQSVSTSSAPYYVAGFYGYHNDTNPAVIQLGHSRSSSVGHTILQNGDAFGALRFEGSDGTAFLEGASVTAVVDGTPGTNDMPGRLVFSTTSDGASTPTERLRISSDGAVKIAGDNFQIATSKTPASATAAGTAGQIAWDASYIYVCTATNTWKRAALSTW
jgi:hypothetical protein